MEKNIIIYGDCFELIKEIDDDSIDLIIFDPPYGMNYAYWDNSKLANSNLHQARFDIHRILKDNGNFIVFQGWSNVNDAISIFDSYFKFNNWIIWDRIKGRGAKRNFISTREDILWFSITDEYTFNITESNIKKKTGGMGAKNGKKNRILSNVWTDIPPIVPWSKEHNNHPTQKPVALYERIIKVFSNPGDLIFDPMCGSGTAAIAANNTDRDYILFEKEIEYIKISRRRIKNEVGENVCHL